MKVFENVPIWRTTSGAAAHIACGRSGVKVSSR